jgi:pilus assembly protein Flp/PilA
MFAFVRRFLADDSGPTAVEYGVMLALIVAACLTSVNLLANNTAQSFDDSASQLAGVLGT